VTSHFPNEELRTHTDDGVEIVRVGRNLLVPFNGAYVDVSIGVRLRRELFSVLERADFDVLHVHNPLAPTLPLMALARDQATLVGTFHMTGPNRLQSVLRRPLGVRVERLAARIAVSETARACAAASFPGRYEVIPNGVDVERFRPDVEPFAAWRDADVVNVLFVGRLDPRKGLLDLLRAMPEVVRRTAGRARLLVVGDSKLRAGIEAGVPQSLQRNVHFVGAVSPEDLPRWYATADVFVSPATGNESFGIVLLEAMASARAVVCADLPGYRSAVVANESALLHAPGNVEDLARAIVTLVNDPARRYAIADAGRSRALRFAWRKIGERIEHLYRAALPARHPAHVPSHALSQAPPGREEDDDERVELPAT
jgi:phosphatidyl-myo-inositol alpha-mannosyltransferase